MENLFLNIFFGALVFLVAVCCLLAAAGCIILFVKWVKGGCPLE